MFFGVGCNFARRRPIATLQSGLVGSAASGSGKRSLLFAPWAGDGVLPRLSPGHPDDGQPARSRVAMAIFEAATNVGRGRCPAIADRMGFRGHSGPPQARRLPCWFGCVLQNYPRFPTCPSGGAGIDRGTYAATGLITCLTTKVGLP